MLVFDKFTYITMETLTCNFLNKERNIILRVLNDGCLNLQ